jgi:hypothetical protein
VLGVLFLGLKDVLFGCLGISTVPYIAVSDIKREFFSTENFTDLGHLLTGSGSGYTLKPMWIHNTA